MGVYKTPREIVKQYYEADGLNQSTLKYLIYGLDYYLKKVQELDAPIKDYLLLGSAVDVQLTGNDGDFDAEFCVSDLEKMPSDAEKEIIDTVYNALTEDVSFESLRYRFLEVATELKWRSTYGDDAKYKTLEKNGKDYYEFLKKSSGKTILTKPQESIIKSVVQSLKTNPRITQYFNGNQQNVDLYYQVPLFFYVDEIPCKAMLDLVVILKDEDGNAIKAIPVDFKTTGDYTIKFPSSFRQYRYDIQAAFYTDALANLTTIFPENFPDMSKCKILPFTFVVESTSYPGKPLVYKVEPETIELGRTGGTVGGNSAILGYMGLLELYKYHSETGWVEEEIVTKNNGVLTLSWNGTTEENSF